MKRKQPGCKCLQAQKHLIGFLEREQPIAELVLSRKGKNQKLMRVVECGRGR